MKKSNIIIHKSDCISDYDTLLYVLSVIGKGKNNNNRYCYVTEFKDGTLVYADKKKADIFTVTRRIIKE